MPTLTGVRLYGTKDTDANWTKNNPLLAAGEIIIVTDSKYKLKVATTNAKYSEIDFPVAEKATKLETSRKIGNASFNGTSDITLSQIGAAAASHTHSKSQITDFPSSLKNPTSIVVKLNGGSTEGTNLFTYDGGTAKTINITPSSIGAATSSHTHSKSQITDFPTTLKNPNSIIIKLNGGSTEGTNLFTYDGSSGKTINITPSGIGAATSGHKHDSLYAAKSHTHNYAGSSSAGGAATSSNKVNISQLSNTVDLNTLTTDGLYYFASGSNNIKNNPVDTQAFEIYIGRNASGYIYQRLTLLDGSVYIRTYGSNTWSAWKTTIDSSNYTTYTVTKSGSGASGTWGISISGNAATATTASSANAVAWGNVNGKPSTFTPSSHTHTKSQITDFPSSMVNPHSIIIKLNGGTTEGTNLFTYNGGSSKTINITAGSIGAAASSHTHSKSQITDFPTSMPASDVYSWAKASSKPSYSWSEIGSKPSTFAPSSHDHNRTTLYTGSAPRPTNINFSANTNGAGTMFHFVASSSTTTGKPPEDSNVLQMNWDNNGGYDSQFAISTPGTDAYFRGQNAGTWTTWHTLLHSDNYTSYTVTKTGSGASGTWGINISGNAATATTANSAKSVAWGNVTGKPSTFTPSSHTHTKSQITDFPSTLANPNSITIKFNGGTTEGTNLFTYNGSSGKSLNITPSAIGAAATSHTHSKSQITDFPTSMPASDVYSWAKASSKPSYSWSEINSKPSTFTPSSHNHSSITRAEHLDTVDKLSAFIEANTFKYATIGALDGLDGLSKNDGIILSASWKNSTTYGHQIYIDDSGYTIAHRYCNQGSWSAWKTLIDTSNYTSYTVTKTGSGASGTWGISISGNAATATTASTANAVAWGNVSGKPSTFTPSSHTHTKSQITDFPSSLKNPNSVIIKLNGGTTEGTNLFTYDGSSVKTINITAGSIGAAASSHTHSKSQITDFPSSMPASDVYTWAKASTKPSYTWNEITGKPSTFTPASHTHANYTIKLNGGTTEGTNLFTYNGSTSKTLNITPSSIGAATSGHNHDSAYAAKSHTHNYAGSSSAGGAATSANKLATSRTLSLNGLSNATFTFDGSGNVSADNWGYGTNKYVTENTADKPYFRIAYTSSSGSYADASMIIIIDSGCTGQGFGILKVAFRTDNIKTAGNSYVNVQWLVRQGFALEQFFVNGYAPANAAQYADLYFKATGTYNGINVTTLSMGGRGGKSRAWTFDYADPRAAADIRTYSYTTTSSDAGVVSYNKLADKPSSYTPSSHTHKKSQITDFPSSMPASDVYSWAKASSKPSYSWSEITGKPSTFTPSSHTHSSITIKLNGGTTEGTNLFTYNGSSAKTLNITPGSIGAAASSHTHSKSQITDFPSSMPASDVYSWAKASSKPSYSWSEITGKPSTFTPSTHNHTSITRAEHLDTVNKLNAFIEANTFKYGTITEIDGLDGLAKNDGIILSASWKDSTRYGHQIYLDDNGYTIAHRYCNQGSWSAWKTLIDTSNYTSYTVTKTGSGASGTWGINITGNAATATTANSAKSVTWGNVAGKPSTFTPTSHTHTKSQITDFPSTMANPHSITIKLNGGSTEGSNLFTYNGSSAKSLNITASSIGAASSGHTHSGYASSNHTHSYLPLSGGTVTGNTTFNNGVTIKEAGLELYYKTPFIDFHYNNDSSDHTSRIIELEKGKLNVNGTVCSNDGSLWCTSFSTDGGGTFGGDLSACRGLYLKHAKTSLYLYNDNGGFVIMHTGADGNSTWPVIWSFASSDLYFAGNLRVSGTGKFPNGIYGGSDSRFYVNSNGGCTASSFTTDGFGTFGGGVNARLESTFCSGSYTDPLPGVSCGIKVSGIASAHRFYVRGRSGTWLSSAQPGGAGFDCVNDTNDSALIPGWRIRNLSGAWVGASYNMDKAFHLYYAKAERLSGNTDNGTDADFIFNGRTGNFSAKSITQTSDERLKDIISQTIRDDYKNLFMKLKPFTYKWNDNPDDLKTHIGLGAQTVYQTALECGLTDEEISFVAKGEKYDDVESPWSIAYTELIPLNITITQEHEDQIQKLKKENKELKDQNESIMNKLNDMEDVINNLLRNITSLEQRINDLKNN